MRDQDFRRFDPKSSTFTDTADGKAPLGNYWCCAYEYSLGCDHEARLTKLEKENEELKVEVRKVNASTNYDLQAKCGRDAKGWFNESWKRDRDTLLLTYQDHYNAKQNRCFVLVEYHYKLSIGDGWAGDEMLYDVYENAKYGSVSVNHITYIKPQFHIEENINECYLDGQKCKSTDEFNNALRAYMND